MNLRCAFCQTPYTLGRIEKLIALQHMDTENLSHYDAHCPRCRKATPVLREKMEATFPDWRDALHELEAQVDAAPASAPKPEAVSAAEAESKPAHHKHRSHSKAKPEVEAPAAKTSSPKGKAVAKKSK
jgi:hypothetical protein